MTTRLSALGLALMVAIVSGTVGGSTPVGAQTAASAELSPTVARPLGDVKLGPGRGEMVKGYSGPVARFFPPGWQATDAVASFALLKVPEAAGPADGALKAVPRFGVTADGRHVIRFDTAAGTSLYGTGEVAGGLLRNGRRTVLWNTDAYGYTVDSPSLYQSHPWVLAVRDDGTAFGVLVDSTWRMEINTAGGAEGLSFIVEGNRPPVYVIERSSPQAVITALAEMVGTMPLPPKWALGYHQCRYSYFPEKRVREVAEGFRSRKMPGSVIWFDIDYMSEYRTFSFDRTRFPDPARLNADLEAMGFKTIWMINPGIKAEPGYNIFDQVISKGFEVKTASGESYRGNVWPGPCAFPDYTNHDVRAWWSGLYKDFMANGIDGVWNDMNEPAIFNVASKTMPEDNRHRGGAYSAWQTPGAAGPQTVSAGDHLRFHNVYGMLMAQATWEGIAAANPDKRPFVLTRAGFMGSHRYAATWTGDNSANWTDLEQSIPMALNLGLSGQPFSGPDIGGFIGNGPGGDDEKAQHFARWMGFGALLPFARGHTAKGNIDKEPWSFGPDAERACRIALQRRYRLLPMFYTLFREASVTGMPVMRPVFFADPKDPALRSEDDSFLLGDGLLVVPQLMPDGSRTPLLPRGIWRKFDVVDESHSANPDLYLRGGTIIPAGPMLEYFNQRPLNELTLYVSLDEKGEAVGTLYEDGEDGFAYRSGDFRLTTYAARRNGDTVTVSVSKREGQRVGAARPVIVKVLTGASVKEGRGTEGQAIEVKVN